MQHVRLEIEPDAATDTPSLKDNLTATIKQRLQFQAEIKFVPAGTLPRFEMKARRLVHET
jgi:phenylacetate-CoA ligase